jgi:hypothetical protein
MIKTYEEFTEKLERKISVGTDFYYSLLKTIIANPNRYTGIFRVSNVKTKLLQNVTQSTEIKFGDFMEEIITEYIEQMGYTILDKNIGVDKSGNKLCADQVFIKDNTVYLIEQKLRDDHDSTKKRGQYENFRKKYSLLHANNPDKAIVAVMWFIDKNLVKNYRYYKSEAEKEINTNINVHICYGKSLFENIFCRPDAWEEITNYLKRNKRERNQDVLCIPDFDTSEEIFLALKKLKEKMPRVYSKLMSSSDVYVQLREELFPKGTNLARLQ